MNHLGAPSRPTVSPNHATAIHQCAKNTELLRGPLQSEVVFGDGCFHDMLIVLKLSPGPPECEAISGEGCKI